MIVYSNSCSFGVVSDGKVYSEFIAEALGGKLVNKGLSGRCNDQIFRTTIRDLLDLRKETKEDVLVLISVSSLYRYDYWTKLNQHPESNDGHFESFQIGSLTDNNNNYYSPEISEFAKHWFITQTDFEALLVRLYFNLTLVTNFLKTNNFKYLIWAGPNDIFKEFDTQAPFIKSFVDECKQSDIIPLADFNFCDYCLFLGLTPFDADRYGKYGHPGEQGHKKFANYLLENYLT